MKRSLSWLTHGLVVAACLAASGCVVAPPRTRVAVVAPAPGAVWVPAHWNRNGVWVDGYWRYP
jgi:hypothetical protein